MDSPYQERLERLRRLLTAFQLHALVLARPEHLRWATGFVVPADLPAALLVASNGGHLFAPEGSVQRPPTNVELCPYPSYRPGRLIEPMAALAEGMARIRTLLPRRARIGIESHHLPASLISVFRGHEQVPIDEILRLERVTKDAAEVAGIRRAAKAVQAALDAAEAACRPGASELDLLEAAVEVIRTSAGEDFILRYNLGSGPRSADPDPRATRRRLEAGDVVLFDLYPTVEGYVADLCRSFVSGGASHDQETTLRALRDVLEATAVVLRPGIPAETIAATLRANLEAALGERAASMWHHAGHGFGLFPWEEPWIGSEASAVLRAGSIVALEPGVYVPGAWGMRLEEDYLILDDGFEILGR